MHQVPPLVGTPAASPFAVPPPFECRWRPDGLGSAWVHIGGELDRSNLSSFRETLRQAQSSADTVTIDVQELAFIDCAALEAIFDAHGLARREGNRLILVRSSGQVDRVMALTGLLEEVEVAELP